MKFLFLISSILLFYEYTSKLTHPSDYDDGILHFNTPGYIEIALTALSPKCTYILSNSMYGLKQMTILLPPSIKSYIDNIK